MSTLLLRGYSYVLATHQKRGDENGPARTSQTNLFPHGSRSLLGNRHRRGYKRRNRKPRLACTLRSHDSLGYLQHLVGVNRLRCMRLLLRIYRQTLKHPRRGARVCRSLFPSELNWRFTALATCALNKISYLHHAFDVTCPLSGHHCHPLRKDLGALSILCCGIPLAARNRIYAL